MGSTHDLLTYPAQHLKAQVDAGFNSCVAPKRSTLAQLETLDSKAARGAQVRSRTRWIEDGESSSAFILHQERKCGVDCTISALRREDGSVVSSPEDLCSSFSSFYSSLFS